MRKGEVGNRFDSLFYVEKNLYQSFIKLSKIAKVSGGKRLPLVSDFAAAITPWRYLRVGDIDWFGNLDYANFNYLPEDVYNALKRYEIVDNELLIAIVGATIGKVALLRKSKDENIILTENCAKISIKGNTVLPEYLLIIMQSTLVQKQIQLNYIQTTLPKLGLERLESLKIPPIPYVSVQLKIVTLFETAQTSKKQKEAEAAELLASIDVYLLQALGIILPKVSEKKDFFYTRSSKVSSGRIDPFYHQREFEELEFSLKNGSYGIQNFFNIITYISSGATPLKSNRENYYVDDIENGVPLLRVQNITAEGLKLDDVIYINFETHEKDLKRSQVFGGDLLITITGRIASSAVAPEKFEGNINQHSVIVRTTESCVLNEFLAIFFNSVLGQKIAIRKTTGGTRPALDYQALKSIKIPIPPLEKQTEIAIHISKLRNRAKLLQQQAVTELESAKQVVEKMILGFNYSVFKERQDKVKA